MSITLLVCGDVMTGRGIDQILSHPSEPEIYESYCKDANDYVSLAEQVHGRLPRHVPGEYVWGDALALLKEKQPVFRIINLETSITRSTTPCVWKGIQYRMHPDNMDVLRAAAIDICSLANNHVMDWGLAGLKETINTLDHHQIAHAGVGLNLGQAQTPVIKPIPGTSRRLLLFAVGMESSGVPKRWQATDTKAGVWLLEDLSLETVARLTKIIDVYRKPDDLCIVSIHWGSNWVHHIPTEHQLFAHALIDMAKVNLVYGHSAHHPIGIELYKGVPILYGCGDLINDYEGISPRAGFLQDLVAMYFLEFEDLYFRKLEVVPFVIKKFTLNSAKEADHSRLLLELREQSAPFKTQFILQKNAICTFNFSDFPCS